MIGREILERQPRKFVLALAGGVVSRGDGKSPQGKMMADQSDSEITLLLQRWAAGDREAEEKLWPILYRELEVLASSSLRRGGGSPTLQTTELLNEACLRLLRGRTGREWPHRGHFFAFSAKVMRRVLIDRARKRRAAKRKAIIVDLPLQIADPSSDRAVGVLEIDEALSRLSELQPRSGQLVELRFFGGLTLEEAAAVLGISKVTASRDWRSARAWLFGQLAGAGN